MSDTLREHDRPAAPGGTARLPIVNLRGITKTFGATVANSNVDFIVRQGEVIGLVGGNGAGKSTLVRILCGALSPTLGELELDGAAASVVGYTTHAAQAHGIRMVHQELSLCTNLSVAENFFVESPGGAGLWPGWRNLYRERARAALDATFPNNGINVDARVGDLAIGQRQMVEIARATAAPGVRLIVLDEPTSALDQERSRQLRAHVRERARTGTAFIFISHKLQEVSDVASEAVVMRNGAIVWRGEIGNTSVEGLVELMGGSGKTSSRSQAVRSASDEEAVIRIGGRHTLQMGSHFSLHSGEIVGLAGLEGHGQKDLLHAIFDAPRGERDLQRTQPASFIAGDRQKEGVLPLWSVLQNISIGRIALRPALSLVSSRGEAEAAASHASRLNLPVERFRSNVGDLSGGNQQKALVARALGTGSPILLLDDPTRGVDTATKQDFYRLCREAADEGRTLVWHTTEDAELLVCDRVLVLANGVIAAELHGDQITEGAIVDAAFKHVAARGPGTSDRKPAAGMLRRVIDAAPFIGLIAVLGLMMSLNPRVATTFGLDLLLLPALSLVLITAAQMFIVGGSEIDLGAGAFAGLTSVLAATVLYAAPLLGVLAILAAILSYGAMGGLIQARRIPAIVVTLGASFIWAGVGYSVQPTPGGSSPEWLSAAINWSAGPFPTSIIMIVVVGLIVVLIDRSPLGVVLRGFGNNAVAMVRSGWPRVRYGIIRYLLAGTFAAAAGLTLTGINYSSDINSGNSYTLLSIAAVVMGGCALIGGMISPIGAISGAVTLSLIGALLGAMNVSSMFNAATQGLVLIVLLVLQSLAARKDADQ